MRLARIAVLGCGAVGHALAVDTANVPGLVRELSVWSRNAVAAARLQRRLGSRRRRTASPEAVLDGADVVLSCVSDGAHVEVARALLPALGPAARPVWLVTSGLLPLGRLAFLRRRGIALGRLHPLAPVQRPPRGKIAGVPFAVEGDARALRAARALATALDGQILRMADGASSSLSYHAGAALLGGGLVALLDQAERALGRGLAAPPKAIRAALVHFARAIVDNVEEVGPAEALTGPLARGSEDAVREHLRALRRVRGADAAYRALGETMLALARERGTLAPDAVRRLSTLLRSAERRG